MLPSTNRQPRSAGTGVSDAASSGRDGGGGSRAEEVARSVSDKQQPKSDAEKSKKSSQQSVMSITDDASVKTGKTHWMFDRHASSHSWCLEQDIEKTVHPSRVIYGVHTEGVKEWVQEFRKHASAYEEKVVLYIPSSDHQPDAIGRLFEDRAAIAKQFFKPASLDALWQRTPADRFKKCTDKSNPVPEWLLPNFPRFLDVVTQVIALSPAGRNRKNHKVSKSDWRHLWELITKEVLSALEIYASSENPTSKVDYLKKGLMSIERTQPRSAICDGLLFIEIPDFFIGLPPGEVDLLDLFSTIRDSDSTKPAPGSANLTPTCQDAFIGIFASEFKTPEAEPGLNQLRLYLTAMVKYLSVLGITDFPVYGVVTEGSIGRLVQAWGHKFSESDDIHVRIVDLHCAEFDLETVEGGLRYAYFLARLVHDDVPKLVKLVKAGKDDFTKRVKAADGSLQWNMVQVHGWDDEGGKAGETGETGGDDGDSSGGDDGAGAGVPVAEAAHTQATTVSSQE
ncbi:hypothetical protein K488DRAFT_72886 [Vararia minispora EC-137]|uniref:Uncharacterized protein n=1 Tax=Vararia minispora EC-137 TaxID=1314806 RepID=A0ACB8QD62_9AGAM|nr:hypothetical protein K488DRAFT_72886 [Vararia minispora EC-137]